MEGLTYNLRNISVRVNQGTHDTLWESGELLPNGWLHVWNSEVWKDGFEKDVKITDERFYPPTSIYSVKPAR